MVKQTQWTIEAVSGGELPKLLHEIRVKDWSLPLVGDYRGCIVAYIAGANWNDPEAVELARQNAELIASAPALKTENELLKAEVERLNKKLSRVRQTLEDERGFGDYMVEKYGGAS